MGVWNTAVNLVLYLKKVLISDVPPFMALFFFLLAYCQYLPWLSSTVWTLLKKTTQANKLPDQSYISKEGKLMLSYKGESACSWSVTQLCWLFVTPQIAACQAPLSMEFSRQEYWSGWPFPSPGDVLNPGIESVSPALAGGFFTTGAPGTYPPWWIC